MVTIYSPQERIVALKKARDKSFEAFNRTKSRIQKERLQLICEMLTYTIAHEEIMQYLPPIDDGQNNDRENPGGKPL